MYEFVRNQSEHSSHEEVWNPNFDTYQFKGAEVIGFVSLVTFDIFIVPTAASCFLLPHTLFLTFSVYRYPLHLEAYGTLACKFDQL